MGVYWRHMPGRGAVHGRYTLMRTGPRKGSDAYLYSVKEHLSPDWDRVRDVCPGADFDQARDRFEVLDGRRRAEQRLDAVKLLPQRVRWLTETFADLDLVDDPGQRQQLRRATRDELRAALRTLGPARRTAPADVTADVTAPPVMGPGEERPVRTARRTRPVTSAPADVPVPRRGAKTAAKNAGAGRATKAAPGPAKPTAATATEAKSKQPSKTKRNTKLKMAPAAGAARAARAGRRTPGS